MVWIISHQCGQFVAENAAGGGISITENDGNTGTSDAFDILRLRSRERKWRACGSIQAACRGRD
jgi:hypothetical protein